MIPNARKNKTIDSLIGKFHELNTVTLALQKETRLLFDEVIEQHRFTKSRLGSNAAIVANPVYKSGLSKYLTWTSIHFLMKKKRSSKFRKRAWWK